MLKSMWMFVPALLLVIGASLRAQEAQPEGEPEPEQPAKEKEDEAEGTRGLAGQIRASLKGVAEVTGKVEINEEQLKQVIKLKAALDEAMKAEREFQQASNRNVKEAFDVLVKSETFSNWAKENELEGEGFARRMFRLQSIFVREYLPEALDQAITYQRRVLEGFKEMLPEDEYADAMKRLAEDEADVARAKEELKVIPEATEAEKKLLASHREALSDMMGMPQPAEEEKPGPQEPPQESVPEESQD